ncbi:SRPBCC family protein [Methylococcus sp. Mc7]|uniref:SRPBCC family protein n=1 Tax=Methylococcus sp. Mc7 TaxID=2860258 RepID=UPI001C532375|nr:SRPBCC family protein [Methylococcus sp. Mc7]QXP82701.1 SRPBCC family protein [Methylococcus sp. Mc7]
MIKLTNSVCINVAAEAVWERLAALEDIQLWSEAVLCSTCDGDVARGVGAERTCELAGNLTIKERWIEWDEGRSFKYEGFGIPLVRRASNHWSVHPEGEHQALLMSEAEIELKCGLLGRLLEPIMIVRMRRMGAQSLAAFKFLVENGRPYEGNHSELPMAPTTC